MRGEIRKPTAKAAYHRRDDVVISLDEVRRVRRNGGDEAASPSLMSASSPQARMETSCSGVPDMAGIAREPSYAERRRKLAAAMRFFSGADPDDRLLDHQMIITGLAAGHGSGDDDDDRGLGDPMDDPAVVVGLVMHYAKYNARRGLPIPSSVLRHLDRHVAGGSAAARVVRDWLGSRSVPCGRRRLWVHDGGQA